MKYEKLMWGQIPQGSLLMIGKNNIVIKINNTSYRYIAPSEMKGYVAFGNNFGPYKVVLKNECSK